jgi:hypothetical protein
VLFLIILPGFLKFEVRGRQFFLDGMRAEVHDKASWANEQVESLILTPLEAHGGEGV